MCLFHKYLIWYFGVADIRNTNILLVVYVFQYSDFLKLFNLTDTEMYNYDSLHI